MTNRQVEYLPIDELKPDPRNPKAHALETIEDSMRRFGFVEPIVLDARTGLIVSGHGRHETLTALRARGEGPPDGVRVDESGRWLAPVATGWASGSDLDAAGALIALNRTGEIGGWVDEALLDLLGELAETKSFDGVGYTEQDRADLEKLLERGEDLDGLADGWDGESSLGDGGGKVIIRLKSPEARDAWVGHRERFGSDDEALLALWPR